MPYLALEGMTLVLLTDSSIGRDTLILVVPRFKAPRAA